MGKGLKKRIFLFFKSTTQEEDKETLGMMGMFTVFTVILACGYMRMLNSLMLYIRVF